MRLMILFIAVCSLTLSLPLSSLAARENCRVCHRGITLSGRHGKLPCLACHLSESATMGNPSLGTNRAPGCVSCHRGKERIFDHAMAVRGGEKSFVARSYGRVDAGFWEKNCVSCHVRSCLDCHEAGHFIRKPTVAACQSCHKGYYTGWDYSGRAPREDNMRYQRGISVNGETFLKMLPDVHYRVGMTCGECHSMESLAKGKKSSKVCRDCHTPSMKPVEHRISAHMEKLECYACHSAWGPQEYGTFYLRFRDKKMKEDFDLKPGPSEEYLVSAYLRRQDAPPLGLNEKGKISPIRPMFIAYYTDILSARSNGKENTLLTSEWRAWFPHTIQRGSVTCEGCHDNPARFLLEPESGRIYQLEKDGLGLESFWSSKGQRVVNGSFMTAPRYGVMSNRSPAYRKAYLQKWKTFLNHVESSSGPLP